MLHTHIYLFSLCRSARLSSALCTFVARPPHLAPFLGGRRPIRDAASLRPAKSPPFTQLASYSRPTSYSCHTLDCFSPALPFPRFIPFLRPEDKRPLLLRPAEMALPMDADGDGYYDSIGESPASPLLCGSAPPSRSHG